MGHYGSEGRDLIPPYIIMQCQTENCYNKGNKWLFSAAELKMQTGYKPGLIQIPQGILCDECHCEPVIIKQEWRVP